MEELSKVNARQKAFLRQYMNEYSGILEGRFDGSFGEEQIEIWIKLRDELSNLGPRLALNECKKVYWEMVSEMNRKKEEKPLTDMSPPRLSNYHEGEDVIVIKEERKEKSEEQSRMIRHRNDGRRRYNHSSGEHSGRRKMKSLSPVSSSDLSSNSPFNSKSSPNNGNSRSKNSYRSRSKSHTRSTESPPGRHRSRSPYRSRRNRSSSHSEKFRRSNSPSRYRRSRSSSRKYDRSMRSPGRSPTRRRNKSISRSSNASGKGSSRYHSRSRPSSRERRHSKSPSSKGNIGSEKKRWEIFRTEVDALEKERWKNEQMYKKNPEKHPEYKSEWKKLYKMRVKELESRGKDPKSYNFESEWAYYWKWKMDELLRKDFEAAKDAIRRKLDLPDDEPRLIHKEKVNSYRGVEESRISPHNKTQGLIPTLRIVTAVEEVLGSLGPQINGLLSQCVAVQRIEGSYAESLLQNQENYILLETVREKLMGQLQSKIVRKTLVSAVSEAINSIDNLLKSSPSPNPQIPPKYAPAIQPQVLTSAVSLPDEAPVTELNVPGVGTVDRVAVAQQIAEALVKQGKTDVTEAELQELVNAVLGMTKTQADLEQTKDSALIEQNQAAPSLPVNDAFSVFGNASSTDTNSSSFRNMLAVNALNVDKDNSALNLLMSVVQSKVKKPDVSLMSFGYDSDESESECSEDKMALKKFTGFKLASKEFKKHLNRDKTGRIVSGFEADTADNSTKVMENFNSSKSRIWEAKGPNNIESGKSNIRSFKELSPFSSRRVNSNPMASDNDKDLKIIGAWDSDSDIDLDASEKTKAPAYEKANIKSGSEIISQKPSSSLTNPNSLENNEKELSKPMKDSSLNINVAIDDLMGSLRKKSSEKPSFVGEQISTISSSIERLPQGSDFSSSQQNVNTGSSYNASYYPQNIPAHFSQPEQYSTSCMPFNNQYYESQNAPNYTANPYNTAAYGYPQNNHPAPQNYYGSGGYEQMNTSYSGYYNYPSNYSSTQVHSTNYQIPYQMHKKI